MRGLNSAALGAAAVLLVSAALASGIENEAGKSDGPIPGKVITTLWSIIYPPKSFRLTDGKDYEISAVASGDQVNLTYQKKSDRQFKKKIRFCIWTPDGRILQDFENELGDKGTVSLNLDVPEGSKIYLGEDAGNQHDTGVPAVSNVLPAPGRREGK